MRVASSNLAIDQQAIAFVAESVPNFVPPWVEDHRKW
jgi:hypothetical protein